MGTSEGVTGATVIRRTVPHPLGIMGPMTQQLSISPVAHTDHGPLGDDRGDDLIIDCDTCIMRRTDACRDCVVTFLIERDDHEAVVLDFAEVRAMRMLADAGLVPTLRHRGGR